MLKQQMDYSCVLSWAQSAVDIFTQAESRKMRLACKKEKRNAEGREKKERKWQGMEEIKKKKRDRNNRKRKVVLKEGRQRKKRKERRNEEKNKGTNK
jgi:hypothetical protein